MKRYDLNEAVTNSEGAFYPTSAEIQYEEAFNSALDAVIEIIKPKV